MQASLHLIERRYTTLDSIGIAFRCAPLAAFFYAFFDLAWAALTPLATLVAGRLIDAVVRSAGDAAAVNEVYRQLLILAGIIAFGWLRSAMHNFADLQLTLALRSRYRTALMQKRTRLQYRLLENSDTWDLIQRVAANPEGGRLKQGYFHLLDLTAFIIKVGGLLGILAAVVWWLPLLVVTIAGAALAIGVRGGKTIYRAEQVAAEHDRRVGYLGEVMLGRDASAERTLFGSTELITALWRKSFHAALKVRTRARWKWYINAYAGNITNQLVWLMLMLVLLVPLQDGSITIGLFLALTQAFTKFDIVWGFMDTVNGIAADGEFFKELSAFLALEVDPGAVGRAAEVRTSEAAPARLELRQVSFRYPGMERLVLDGLDMTLEPGKQYALVGANGCGKTTVTRLISGLYAPGSGSIRFNGRDIGEFRAGELQSLIAIVYQDFARYGVSLRENIFLGREGSAAEKEILEKAGMESMVARLAQGADTPLGKYLPEGSDISGGEWQRVAMARSLACPAGLRILDEPTAALDPVAESELYANFERLTEGATTLLITHRLGATRTADVIMVMDGGRIVETGSHGELMRARGLYNRMFTSQRYWYETD